MTFRQPSPGDAHHEGLISEAAALGLLAVQHLGTVAFLSRYLETSAFMACQRVADLEVQADPRIATGEVVSQTLVASLDVLHEARALREELDESLGEVLPWCASVQVRAAQRDRLAIGGQLQ